MRPGGSAIGNDYLTLEQIQIPTLSDRVLLILSKAGQSKRLTWTEVEQISLILERWSVLADNMFWAVYQSLLAREEQEPEVAVQARSFDREAWLAAHGAHQ